VDTLNTEGARDFNFFKGPLEAAISNGPRTSEIGSAFDYVRTALQRFGAIVPAAERPNRRGLPHFTCELAQQYLVNARTHVAAMVRAKEAQQVEFMVRGLGSRAEFALCWGGAPVCVLRAVVASRFFEFCFRSRLNSPPSFFCAQH
jgi:hypothetical protein